MFAKTCCKPGSFVEFVPIGLLVKLQYNQNGVLEGASIDVGYSYEPCSAEQFNYIKSKVPQSIRLSGGTTWVDAVITPRVIPDVEGVLPYCIYPDIIGIEDVKVFGVNVNSLAAAFRGPRVVRNWLSTNKFEPVPGMVIPSALSDEVVKSALNIGSSAEWIKYPFISELVEMGVEDTIIHRIDMNRFLVASVSQVFTESGYLMDELKHGSDATLINATSGFKFNIQKGSYVIMHDGKPIASTPQNKMRPSSINCMFCGKPISLAQSGPVQCEDENCLSRNFGEACKILNVFDLPALSYTQYIKGVKDKEITCVTDVLELPDYRDLRISGSLEQVIRAAVPTEICPFDNFLFQFVGSCNHSVDTFKYYIEHPLQIRTELLSEDSEVAARLIAWLADPYNSSTVLSILSRVTVITPEKKFDGAPIFRNRTFMITGKFKRGSLNDITSIIKSYSGSVITPGEAMICDAVIVGDLNTDIDGKTIQSAKLRSIPVLSETQFFEQFDIDSDIAANLL